MEIDLLKKFRLAVKTDEQQRAILQPILYSQANMDGGDRLAAEVEHQRPVEQSGSPGAFYPWDRR